LGEEALLTKKPSKMEARDITAAFLTIALVAAGVIVATVIMNRFCDLLSLVEAPREHASGT
jgi:hypothetical protein